MEYIDEWEQLTERMAYWVDLPTRPMSPSHNEYVESLWWILKQFWDKDLIYQGYKVVPYCPRCGTPLSSHELALGYKEGTIDPSVFVKFPVQRSAAAHYLLVWTTTPWTLPGNVALAVGADIDYVRVRDVERRRADAGRGAGRARAAARLRGAATACKGSDLAGMHYEPLYTLLAGRAGLLLRGRRRLCQHRGRHGHRPYRAGLWRRRHGGRARSTTCP